MGDARGANVALLLLVLWAPALRVVARVWNRDPAYAYGWVVPLLAAFLFSERWRTRPSAAMGSRASFAALLVFAAPLAASRLFLEPFPDWTAMLWVYVASLIGITAAYLAGVGGGRYVRHFLVPIVFMLTALPWPTVARHGVLDRMQPFITANAANLINEFVGPAVAHGTVIETARGTLGVDEACAGLRSLESLVMFAVFFGEYLSLVVVRRIVLGAAAIGIAIGTNLVRTTVLAAIAVHQGLEAVAVWHDCAGYLALALGLSITWGIAYALSPKRLETAWGSSSFRVGASTPRVVTAGVSIAAVGVMFVVEAGTVCWFRSRNAASPTSPSWCVRLPAERPAFTATAMPLTSLRVLAATAGQNATWRGEDGRPRAAYFAEWTRGHSARFQLSVHTPQACLSVSGAHYLGQPPPIALSVHGLDLPLRVWSFDDPLAPFSVYTCALQLPDGTVLPRAPGSRREWLRWRWDTLLRRERDERVAVVALAIWNPPRDDSATRTILTAELGAMIVPAGPR